MMTKQIQCQCNKICVHLAMCNPETGLNLNSKCNSEKEVDFKLDQKASLLYNKLIWPRKNKYIILFPMVLTTVLKNLADHGRFNYKVVGDVHFLLKLYPSCRI